MCIGCGLCQSITPDNKIKLVLQPDGFERPIANQNLTDADVDRVYRTCPSTTLRANNNASQNDLVWGSFEEIYLSFAVDPQIRHLGSTGGLLTALSLYLLETGLVDFILHARQHRLHASFGEATISRSREQVIDAAGSRYGPTATLINIDETIEDTLKANERFVFIGTPCDVTALRNYALESPTVDETCLAMMTMVCGGFMDTVSLSAFLSDLGIKATDVATIRYRGLGCPGDTVIRMKDGEERRFTYLDFWGEDDSVWGLPARCKICPDGIGEAADIAASDTWDGGSPTVASLDSDPGTNAALVRTERGKAIMDGAIKAGYLTRGDNLTPQDMSRFQPHQENKKRTLKARLDALRSAGQLTPETHDLRLAALDATLSDADRAREYEGTTRRIEQNRFSEPTPQPCAKRSKT